MASNAPLGEMIIELSLDSSDFGKSLRSSKNEVKYWSNSMKAGMKAADNAGNTLDRLERNVEGLTKTIGAQQKVVDRLKESYDNSFNKKTGEATRNTERYAQQLRKAESDLENYRADLKQATGALAEYKVKTEGVTGTIYKKSQALEKASKRVQRFGEGLRSFGRSMTFGVTAPLTAVAGYAVKAAMDYESAFVGLRKTNEEVVDSNGNVIYSFDQLSDELIDLSTEIPLPANELARLGEIAGQLNVPTDEVAGFTEVVSKMGVATDLSAEQAAESMAKFLNLTGSGVDTVDRLGSSIVALGNNMATHESQILEMSEGWAATGALIGMADHQILAFSATLSAMGVEAQAGSGSMQRLLMQIQTAVSVGGAELEGFAKAAGMSAQEFARAWEEDPARAMQALVDNMSEVDKAGGDVIAMLDTLGINNVRDQRALLGLVQGNEQLARALGLSADAYQENNALNDEAAEAFDTFASKLEIFKNKVKKVAIELGGPLIDALSGALDAAEPWIDRATEMAEAFAEMDEEQQRNIISWGLFLAAIGPVSSVLGNILVPLGKLGGGLGKLAKKLIDMKAEKAGKLAMEEFAESMIGAGGVASDVGDEVVKGADKVGDAIEGAGKKGGNGASLFANPWLWKIGAVVAALGGLAWAINHDLKSAQRNHEEAVKKTDGAYQEWFDGVVEGSHEIEKLNKTATAGAEDITEAYKKVSDQVKQTNEDIMNLSNGSRGNFIDNLVNTKNNVVSADINQDGNVVQYRMPNLTTALEEFNLAKSEIESIMGVVEKYQIQLGNSFAEIARQYAENAPVTAEWANSMVQTYNGMAEQTISRLEEMKQAEINKINENVIWGEKEKEERIRQVNEKYDAEIDKVEQSQDTILSILKEAAESGKALTDEQVVAMMEAYHQLAESTGKSLSEIDGVTQLIGENLSAFTSQAGLEFLEMAGMIDQGIVDSVANAPTSKEKIDLLKEALVQYNETGIPPKHIETNADETRERMEQLGFVMHEIDGQQVWISTDSNSLLTKEQIEQLGLEAVHVNGQYVYIPSGTNAQDTESLVASLEGQSIRADGTRVNIPSSTNAPTIQGQVERLRNSAQNKTFTVTGIFSGIGNMWGAFRRAVGFEKGTLYHPGGWSIVNDQKGPYFREYVELPSGQGFIPEGRNVPLNLPRGSKVLKASQTKRAFKDLPQYAKGVGNISVYSPTVRKMAEVHNHGGGENHNDKLNDLVLLLVERSNEVLEEIIDFKNKYNPDTDVYIDSNKLIGHTKRKMSEAINLDLKLSERRE